MTIRTRRFILAFFVLLFFIIGPLIVLYGLGWRVHFSPFAIARTGALIATIQPEGAFLQLNGKPLTLNTDKEGVLVSGLLPGTYTLKVSKLGYRPWKKTVSVRSSLITEIQAVLIPETKPTTLLAVPVHNFAIEKNQLIWQDDRLEYFVTQLDNLESSFNVSRLFNYLKQTQLGLPGLVLVTGVLPMDTQSLFTIQTAKSSYLLDIARLTLKTLPELEPDTVPSETATTTPYGETRYRFLQEHRNLYFIASDEVPSPATLIANDITKFAYDSNANRLYLFIQNELQYLSW